MNEEDRKPPTTVRERKERNTIVLRLETGTEVYQKEGYREDTEV